MLFALLEPNLDRLLREARDGAVQLLAHWVEEKSSKTLLAASVKLADASKRLLAAVPSPLAKRSNLHRHVHFLGYWLERDSKASSTSDILDINLRDLPEIESSLIAEATQRWSLDLELRNRTHELLEEGKFPEAIRNAFLVLTERLRTLKRGVRQRDGHALIEGLFGDSGRMVAYMADGPRRAAQNLLLGLYSVIRNPHAHQQLETAGPEAVGLVLMIDRVLKELARIKRLKRRRGAVRP